jgi:CHAT domain-containing protein
MDLKSVEKMTKGRRSQRNTFRRKGDKLFYEAIPNTKIEVKKIENILNKQGLKQKHFLGKEALEDSLKTNIEARIFHFGTHSYYNEKNISWSAIAFSQPSKKDSLLIQARKKEDGSLFYYEIPDLEIEADLVVLSGCETGLGVNLLEGHVSLAKSFLYAGVPNVISSMWAIDDKRTALLMGYFYEDLYSHSFAQQDYVESLQKSIFKMIKNPNTSNPKYWAAFRIHSILKKRK